MIVLWKEWAEKKKPTSISSSGNDALLNMLPVGLNLGELLGPVDELRSIVIQLFFHFPVRREEKKSKNLVINRSIDRTYG